MKRTTWFFTMGAVWAAPHAGEVACFVLSMTYGVLAFYSWYREYKHKEDPSV